MSDAMHPSPVPWRVVESVLLGLSRLQPASLRITRDPGGRLLRHLAAPLPGEPPMDVHMFPGGPSCAAVSCVAWIGDGDTASAEARREVVAHALHCAHEIVLCEPVVPGCGVGLHMLRAIDPHALELLTDEVGAGPEHTRERRPWEPLARWIVATAAAWRFGDHAELARDGFIARLDRMTPAQMILAARRVLTRFPRAHELLLLAIDALCIRGDEHGARLVWNELSHHDDAAPVLRRARARLLDTFFDEWPKSARPRATG